MTREDALQLMSPRLYNLLGIMHSAWARWMPQVGFPRSSAGFWSGGSVQDFEDLEEQADAHAIQVLETAWIELNIAERTCVEMVLGRMPWVWTVRPGVMESAIAKLERKLREIGAG